MTAVAPYLFEGDKPVRIVLLNGEPWFVAADVCQILELSGDAGQHVRRLDDDEKRKLPCHPTDEGTHNVSTLSEPPWALAPTTLIQNQGGPDIWGINESGLYSFILRSDKPSAKRFRKWVTAEVLPTIRKTGRYSAKAEAGLDIQTVTRMLEAARKIGRSHAIDVANRILPLVSVGPHVVPMLPGRPTPDRDTARVIERLRQKDVPAMERARAYRTLMDQGYTTADIASVITRSRRNVQQHLALLTLSPKVTAAIEAGKLLPRHVRDLTKLKHSAQDVLLPQILNGGSGWKTGEDIGRSIHELIKNCPQAQNL